MHASSYFYQHGGAFIKSSLKQLHNRSISLDAVPTVSPYPPQLSKVKSTSALTTMATIEQVVESPEESRPADGAFYSMPTSQAGSATDLPRKTSTSSQQPESGMEMATLNDKLVDAINRSTGLDDKLAQARQELEASKARIAALEAEANTQKQSLAEEKREKLTLQQEKRGIESELENLTASLFDEANRMVAEANKQRDAIEKKNQQLRDQIKDGESVIASQTEQLSELKLLMQDIGGDYRKDLDSPRNSLTPSSPAFNKDETNLSRLLEAMNLTPISPENERIQPCPSTTFTHLLKPQCRSDIPAYEDFRNLIQNANYRSHNPSHAPSRAGSGSYGGLNVMGLGSLTGNHSNPNLTQTSQSSTSKLANPPALPGSFSPTPDTKGPLPLKDTKFFKRIMAEDVEPTLRLDLSPTISWLNRRSILTAFADSTLIVEPIPEASARLYGRYTPCALCGESRKEQENPRTHAMRVRDSSGAVRWSICKLCLEKVRGVGDLVAYVRMIREGVVKCGDKHEEEEAWEELVRLRERLFWARMAGGVVPAFLPSTKNSPVVVDADALGLGEPRPETEQTEQTNTAADEKDEPGPAEDLHTPDADNGDDREPNLQLQQSLDEALTTFDNARERINAANASGRTPPGSTSPPSTPSQKRVSGGTGFPRLNIPKIPSGFWESHVNVLR